MLSLFSGGVQLTNPIKTENNLFAFFVRRLSGTNETGLGGAYNNNIYVQKKGKVIAANGPKKNFFNMDKYAASNIEKILGDKNATIITILN